MSNRHGPQRRNGMENLETENDKKAIHKFDVWYTYYNRNSDTDEIANKTIAKKESNWVQLNRDKDEKLYIHKIGVECGLAMENVEAYLDIERALSLSRIIDRYSNPELLENEVSGPLIDDFVYTLI